MRVRAHLEHNQDLGWKTLGLLELLILHFKAHGSKTERQVQRQRTLPDEPTPTPHAQLRCTHCFQEMDPLFPRGTFDFTETTGR